MHLKHSALWLVPVVVILHAFSIVQEQREAIQMWLTTADRSALLSLRASPLHFSGSSNTQLVIDVNDMAQYQRM